MPAKRHARVLAKDEELGKRDDDFRPRARSSTPFMPRVRPRRLILFLIGLLVATALLWRKYTIEQLGYTPPEYTELSTGESFISAALATTTRRSFFAKSTATSSKNPENDAEGYAHLYDGPVFFPSLGKSLQSFIRLMGVSEYNQNVLFVAASLKSAANMLPLACEMARHERIVVHLALLGREDLSVAEVLRVNGFESDNCSAHLHDGRIDRSQQSTPKRLKQGVKLALKHLQTYLLPQVVLMDDVQSEEEGFVRLIRTYCSKYSKPLIELPAGHHDDFSWMADLDAHGLANFHRPTIDIVIEVASDRAAQTIRLLRSLQHAYYAGLRLPRITLLLPGVTDAGLMSFLDGFQWPPKSMKTDSSSQSLIIRTRASLDPSSARETTQRLIESFYPANAGDNHVLILSSQLELSPMCLHYLYYTLLAYRYSSLSSYTIPSMRDLVGVSLMTPSTTYSTTPNQTPSISSANGPKQLEHSIMLSTNSATPALLIFGDKWLMFRDFVQSRWKALDQNSPTATSNETGHSHSQWQTYLSEISALEGWLTLSSTSSFAYIPDQTHPEIMHDKALHRYLHLNETFPQLSNLRLFDKKGSRISFVDHVDATEELVFDFRRDVGGCVTGATSALQYDEVSGKDDAAKYFCFT